MPSELCSPIHIVDAVAGNSLCQAAAPSLFVLVVEARSASVVHPSNTASPRTLKTAR